MHGSMLLLVALSGLGCHNFAMPRAVGMGAAATGQGWGYSAGQASAYGAVPYGESSARYSTHSRGLLGGYDSSSNACRDVVKSTIVSFILGRDSDVMTAKDIENRWNSGGYPYGYRYGD
jgi:hypothetical protein